MCPLSIQSSQGGGPSSEQRVNPRLLRALAAFRCLEEFEELPAASVLAMDGAVHLDRQLAEVARTVDRLGSGDSARRCADEPAPDGAASPLASQSTTAALRR